VVEACPVPVILYNVPGRTGVNMEADTTLRIANLSKKVIAVKEASGDLAQFAKIIANAPEHFKVISGDDALTYPSIAIGSIGIISVLGNAMPAILSQLTHAALNKNMQLAADLHLKLTEMFKLIFREGNPAGVKALMEIMGTGKNQVRLPLVSVSAATHSMIENELKRIV
ncbi:MAG: dihydrodipicolinate synthase family protein, partial [Methylococcaceae bacterium]